MARVPDWPERLHHLLLDKHHQPIFWGQWDCAQLALAVLQAVRPEDWHALQLPTYHDANSAKAALQQLGVSSLPELCSHVLGPPIKASLAGRGDLVLVGRALGVHLGDYIICCGKRGLVRVALPRATLCWRL
jgi:hypothetical protein